MLAHLLGEAGIAAHIQGESLQLAAGELPAGNLIKLAVADEDAPRARALLSEWDSKSAPPDPSAAKARFPSVVAAIFLILGLLGGWLIKGYVVHSQGEFRGERHEIDRNGDGIADITYFYAPGAVHAYKSEADHNFDRVTDTITHYDAGGSITGSETDDNFDGVFEDKSSFVDGIMRQSDIDTDGNGVADHFLHFEHATLVLEEIADPTTGRVVRANHYANGLVDSADFDDNRDGVLETHRTFDRFGTVLATTRLPHSH